MFDFNRDAESSQFLRSLGRLGRAFHRIHIRKPYTTFRTLRDMADAFDDGQFCDQANPLLETLTLLDSSDVIVDIGAGRAAMIRQYLTESHPERIGPSMSFPPLTQRCHAIAVDISKSKETVEWEGRLEPNVRARYRYVEGYFEAVRPETITRDGLASLCLDFYGGASYTLRFDEYLRQLTRIARPGCQVFMVFNGVADETERGRLLQIVRARVERLWESIQRDRLGGLGREIANGETAKKLFHSFVLTLGGKISFIEDWLENVPGFSVRRFAATGQFSIPILLRFTGIEVAKLPTLRLVEANEATPPYRLFREIAPPGDLK